MIAREDPSVGGVGSWPLYRQTKENQTVFWGRSTVTMKREPAGPGEAIFGYRTRGYF